MSTRPEDRLLARICGAVSYGLGLHCTLEQAEIVRQHLDEAGLVIEQGWQPIETAPRDGTPMLAIALPNQRSFIVRWRGSYWMDGGLGLRDPTHWRPLPAAPEAPR